MNYIEFNSRDLGSLH